MLLLVLDPVVVKSQTIKIAWRLPNYCNVSSQRNNLMKSLNMNTFNLNLLSINIYQTTGKHPVITVWVINYDIKPSKGSSQSVVHNIRLEKVLLARLRFGYKMITHSYLLNREEQPLSNLFTVRHILLECVIFSNVRNKYYHVDAIK